jgi:hypothetical protein
MDCEPINAVLLDHQCAGDQKLAPRLIRALAGCTPGAGFNLHLAFDFLDQNQRWSARGSC